jgi:hypothetical protein
MKLFLRSRGYRHQKQRLKFDFILLIYAEFAKLSDAHKANHALSRAAL